MRVFFVENGVELSQRFWRHTTRRIRGSQARTIDRVPTIQELREILLQLPIIGKALFLFLASSGARIGEALQIQLGDVNLNTTPLRITIRGNTTKSGNGRVVFASQEAKEAIAEWLKTRDEYLR